MPLTQSAPPASGQDERARASSESQKPKATMRDAPDRRRQHHRQAVAVDARRPAAGQAGDERAHRGRGVEQPEDARPAQPLGEGGEQRQRHAEDHRHEVDDVGADQLLPAARVAEPLAQALEARALRAFAAAARARISRMADEGEDVACAGPRRRSQARPTEAMSIAADRRTRRSCPTLPRSAPSAAAAGISSLSTRRGVMRLERRALQAVERRHAAPATT